jgi:lipopolysaccharide transport protein LptA
MKRTPKIFFLKTMGAWSRRITLSLVALSFNVTNVTFAELIEDSDDFKDIPSGKANQAHPQTKVPHTDEGRIKPSANSTVNAGGNPSANPSGPQNWPAGDQKSAGKSRAKQSKAGIVKFWSRSLSGFRDQGSVILEEDVVVTQDDIRLEADKATIFFQSKSHDVKEVHAIGSVKFSRTDPDTGQPIRAEGREAIFSNAKRLVTMKGEPVLHRGDDVVRGKVIYYDLNNGWVKADRVEGVVQPATTKKGPVK